MPRGRRGHARAAPHRWLRHGLRPLLRRNLLKLLKFTALKLIIFLTFWQFIAISVLVALNVIRGDEEKTQGEIATDLQDWLMCVEVLPFAFLMYLAYPVNLVKGVEGEGEGKGGALELSSSKELKAAPGGPEVVKRRRGPGFLVNFRHALAVNDVIDDTRTYTDSQYGDFTSLGREGDDLGEDEEEGAGGYDAFRAGAQAVPAGEPAREPGASDPRR